MAQYYVNLGITIDTTKMERAIKDIQRYMTELQKKGTLNGVKITEEQKKQYLSELGKLFDAVQREFTKRKFGMGNIPMAFPSEELEKAVASFNKLNIEYENNTKMASAAVREQIKLADSIEKTTLNAKASQAMFSKFSKLAKNMAMISLVKFGFNSVESLLGNAIDYVSELDKAMTNIRIVTGATDSEIKGFAEDYNKMAQEMGRSTTEIADAYATFYRQGRTGADARSLVEATIIGAGVSGEQLTDVADKLTATINGFQLASTEALSVMDKFAVLDANMSTSFKEMSYAMTKIAASAKNAGMSLDQALALDATVLAVTREAPENAGTALKTMFARARGVTTEGAITDATKENLNTVEKALRGVGIALRDEMGDLRNTYEVFNDLGEKWESIGSLQKAYIANAIAGSRQTTRFYAMIENWDMVKNAERLAETSGGKATEQFERSQRGLQFQLNQTKAAVEELYSTFTNSSTISSFNEMWRSVVSTLNEVLKIVRPSTIAFIGMNRALANAAKTKWLPNIDFNKPGSFIRSVLGVSEETIPLKRNTESLNNYAINNEKYKRTNIDVMLNRERTLAQEKQQKEEEERRKKQEEEKKKEEQDKKTAQTIADAVNEVINKDRPKSSTKADKVEKIEKEEEKVISPRTPPIEKEEAPVSKTIPEKEGPEIIEVTQPILDNKDVDRITSILRILEERTKANAIADYNASRPMAALMTLSKLEHLDVSHKTNDEIIQQLKNYTENRQSLREEAQSLLQRKKDFAIPYDTEINRIESYYTNVAQRLGKKVDGKNIEEIMKSIELPSQDQTIKLMAMELKNRIDEQNGRISFEDIEAIKKLADSLKINTEKITDYGVLLDKIIGPENGLQVEANKTLKADREKYEQLIKSKAQQNAIIDQEMKDLAAKSGKQNKSYIKSVEELAAEDDTTDLQNKIKTVLQTLKGRLTKAQNTGNDKEIDDIIQEIKELAKIAGVNAENKTIPQLLSDLSNIEKYKSTQDYTNTAIRRMMEEKENATRKKDRKLSKSEKNMLKNSSDTLGVPLKEGELPTESIDNMMKANQPVPIEQEVKKLIQQYEVAIQAKNEEIIKTIEEYVAKLADKIGVPMDGMSAAEYLRHILETYGAEANKVIEATTRAGAEVVNNATDSMNKLATITDEQAKALAVINNETNKLAVIENNDNKDETTSTAIKIREDGEKGWRKAHDSDAQLVSYTPPPTPKYNRNKSGFMDADLDKNKKIYDNLMGSRMMLQGLTMTPQTYNMLSKSEKEAYDTLQNQLREQSSIAQMLEQSNIKLTEIRDLYAKGRPEEGQEQTDEQKKAAEDALNQINDMARSYGVEVSDSFEETWGNVNEKILEGSANNLSQLQDYYNNSVKQVFNMKRNAFIRNAVGELGTLIGSSIIASMGYSQSRASAANRFEARTAQRQYEMQMSTMTLSASNSALKSGLDMASSRMSNQLLGEYVRYSKGEIDQATFEAAQTNINNSINRMQMIGAVVSTGLQAVNGVIQTIQQAQINQERAEYDALNKQLSEYTEKMDKIQKARESILKVGSAFDTLAKGVDASGRNISLTNEEFAEYHRLVEELIAINPNLISGYDAQGRALISTTMNLESYLNALEREQELLNANVGFMDRYLNEHARDITYENYTSDAALASTGFEHGITGQSILEGLGRNAGSFAVAGGALLTGNIPIAAIAGLAGLVGTISDAVTNGVREHQPRTREEEREIERARAQRDEAVNKSSKEILDNILSITKSTDELYKSLNDRQQKIVDLALDRYNIAGRTAAVVNRRAEAQGITPADEEAWARIVQVVENENRQIAENLLHILSRPENEAMIDAHQRAQALNDTVLTQNDMSMREYTNRYEQMIEEELALYIQAHPTADQDTIDLIRQNLSDNLSVLGSDVMKTAEKLRQLGYDTDNLSDEITYDVGRLMANMSTAYQRNTGENPNSFSQANQDLVNRYSEYRDLLQEFTEAEGSMAQAEVIQRIQAFMESNAIPNAAMYIQAIRREIDQMAPSLERVQEIGNSWLSSMSSALSKTKEGMDLITEATKKGQISITDTIALLNKFPKAIDAIKKSVNGMLIIDTGKVSDLVTARLIDDANNNKKALEQLENNQKVNQDWLNMSKIILTDWDPETGRSQHENATEWLEMLEQKLANNDIEEYVTRYGLTREALQSIVDNGAAYTDELDVIFKSSFESASKQIRNKFDIIQQTLDEIERQIKTIETITLDTRLLEWIKETNDEIRTQNKELRSLNKTYRETEQRVKEIESGEAAFEIVHTLAKAKLEYESTMKTLTEDELTLNFNKAFLNAHLELSKLNTNVTLLKANIDIIGDTDPSATLSMYADIMGAAATQATIYKEELQSALEVEPKDIGEVNATITQLKTAMDGMISAYKDASDAEAKMLEIKRQVDSKINTYAANASAAMIKYGDTIENALTSSLSLLSKGSALGGIKLQRINVFENVNFMKNTNDPVQLMKNQHLQMLEEQKRYQEKLAELEKLSKKDELDTKTDEILMRRVEAAKALKDAFVTADNAMENLGDEYKTLNETLYDTVKAMKQTRQAIENLNKTLQHQEAYLEKYYKFKDIFDEASYANSEEISTWVAGASTSTTNIELQDGEEIIDAVNSLRNSIGETAVKAIMETNPVDENSAELIMALDDFFDNLGNIERGPNDEFSPDNFNQALRDRLNESGVNPKNIERIISSIDNVMTTSQFNEGYAQAYAEAFRPFMRDNTYHERREAEQRAEEERMHDDWYAAYNYDKRILSNTTSYGGLTAAEIKAKVRAVMSTNDLPDGVNEWTSELVKEYLMRMFPETVRYYGTMPASSLDPFINAVIRESMARGVDLQQAGLSIQQRDYLHYRDQILSELLQNPDISFEDVKERMMRVLEDARRDPITGNMVAINEQQLDELIRALQALTRSSDLLAERNNVHTNIFYGYGNGSSISGYADGTTGLSTNEHAITGEYGEELAILPNGQTRMLGKNGPEISHLPKGTVIYNHRDTEKIKKFIPHPTKENNYMQYAGYASGTTIFHPLNHKEQFISQQFGAVHKLEGTHKGTDLAAASGTPVYSVLDGTVIESQRHSAYGETIVVKHSDGTTARYAHMFDNSRKVNVGDTVKRGQQIGNVGTTGYSTGNHLHFEFRNASGVAIDASEMLGLSKVESPLATTLSVADANKYRKTIIDNFNQRFKQVLSNKGEAVMDAAMAYGIDPILLGAIMANETGWGTAPRVNNYNNPGGIRYANSEKFRVYSSIEDGIRSMASLLKTEYIDKGLTTIDAIHQKYCPPNDPTDTTGANARWGNVVKQCYNNLATGIPNVAQVITDLVSGKAIKDITTLLETTDTRQYGQLDYWLGELRKSAIRKYADGTIGTPETGPALVGEHGSELAVMPNGQVKMLGANGPELAHLPQGTVIYNHRDTKLIKRYVPNAGNQPLRMYNNGALNGITPFSDKKVIQSSNALQDINKKISEIQSIIDNTEKMKNPANWNILLKDLDDLDKNIEKLQSIDSDNQLMSKKDYDALKGMVGKLQSDIASGKEMKVFNNEEEVKAFGKGLTEDMAKLAKDYILDKIQNNIEVNISEEDKRNILNNTLQPFKEYAATAIEHYLSGTGYSQYPATEVKELDLSKVNKFTQLTVEEIAKLRKEFSSGPIRDLLESLLKQKNMVPGGYDNMYKILEAAQLGLQKREDLDRQVKDLMYLRSVMYRDGEDQEFLRIKSSFTQMTTLIESLMARLTNTQISALAEELGVKEEDFRTNYQDMLYKYAMTNTKEFETLLLGLTNAEKETIEQIIQTIKETSAIYKKYGVDLSKITSSAVQELEKQLAQQKNDLTYKYNLAIAQQMNKMIDNFNKQVTKIQSQYKRGALTLTEAAEQMKATYTEMNYLLLHAQRAQTETEIKQYELWRDDAERRAEAAYAAGDKEAFSQAVSEYETYYKKVDELREKLISIGKQLYEQMYKDTFERFDKGIKQLEQAFNNAVSFNQAIGRENNALYNVQLAKKQLQHSKNIMKTEEQRIEKLKAIREQLDPQDYEEIAKLDQQILDAEQKITEEKIKQIQYMRQALTQTFEVVREVSARMQTEIDRMAKQDSLKDTLTTIQELKLQIMEIKGIWNSADMSISWDARLQTTWTSIASYIDGVYDSIDMLDEIAQIEDELANISKERVGLDPTKDADKIIDSMKKQTELIAKQEIHARNMQKLEQQRINALNEQLRLAKQQKAAQQQAYQMLIDAKKEELKKLQEAKDAQQKENEMLDLRLALIKALDDTSHSYITGAGIEVMRPDQSKVDEAREALKKKLDEEKAQQQIDLLQKEIDELEEIKDKLAKMADAVIAGYELQIQQAQTRLDSWKELADYLDSNYEKMMTGIAPMILDQLAKQWETQLDGWKQFTDGFSDWFSHELGDGILTPIIDSIEKFSEAFVTGIEDQDAAYSKLQDIIDEDFAKAVEGFKGEVDKFASVIAKIEKLGDKYIKDLSDLLQGKGSVSKPSTTTSRYDDKDDDVYPSYPKVIPTGGDEGTTTTGLKVGSIISGDAYTIYDKYDSQTGQLSEKVSQGTIKGKKYEITKVLPNGVFQIKHANSSALQRYYIKTYAKGGLVDYTGLTWLDGTRSNPESVLSANDTKNLMKLTDVLRKTEINNILTGLNMDLNASESLTGALRELAYTLQNAERGQQLNISIDNITLPDVQNGEDFVEQLYGIVNDTVNRMV